MSDSIEKLRQELQAAQCTVAELQDQLENRETTHRLTTLELEESRSALLFMLEDLEAGRKKIEQAHQEWMAALDVVNDPIFLHDKEFRILRCNKAYQQRAGIPFDELIGQPYYEVFPKTGAPLPCCLRAMEKAEEEEEEEEEEVAVGEAIYRSRSFSVHDKQGAHFYSVHILEDITDSKRAAKALSGSEARFRNLVETTSDWIWEVDENAVYTYVSPRVHAILGYEPAEVLGKTPFELMPAEEAQRVADIFGSIVAAKKSFSNIENTNLHKDGHWVALETSAVPVIDPEGKFCGYRGIDRDITERKRAEDALLVSEEKFRKITESAQDAIIMMGVDQYVSFWNAAAERIFGYTAAEAIGQELHALIVPEPAYVKFAQAFPHFQASGEGPVIGKVVEVTARRKGGEEFPVELSVSAAQFGGQWHAISIVRDITERKQAEAALRKSKDLLQSVVENAPICVFWKDRDLRYLGCNTRFAKDAGRSSPDELTGNTDFDMGWKDQAELYRADDKAVMESGNPKLDYEEPQTTPDGNTIWLRTSKVPLRDESNRVIGILGIYQDITERKKAEEVLAESEEKYRSIYENTQVGLYRTRISDGKLMMANDAMAKMFGFDSVEEATAKYNTSEHYVDPGTRERLLGAIRTYGKFDNFEARLTRNDGIARWFQYSGRLVQNKGYIEGVATDITDHKQAEAAVQHANRALATLGAVNRNLVHATNEDELLQAICQAIVRQRGYRLAWVGYVQHDESKSIKIMAHAGHDEGYLDATQITWAENERGKGPTGRAIRSGATQLCQDIANDPLNLPWRDAELQRGYAASIALPLLNRDSTVFGTLTVYAEEVNAFSPGEISLLEEMAGDLAFGVRTLHTRQQRDNALVKNQEQLVQLHKSLEDTVRAMAAIVEMRDPYTAGHQARVADLATAIAKQIGLPEEQVHGIHLAGTVHDLGKINVPAEILSKPGKITDIERSLIKIHPQAGYDILKGIDFPWPIAQMVLQHHERFDGSGYPQGLKGDQIIIEARILCVADVVEAMSSHRPYRPGLGIETAIEDITRQRGIYYDPQAVDACLALFREQGYRFK